MSRTPKKNVNPDIADKIASDSKSKTRQISKTETLIALLKRKQGVSILEMMEATGWQSHSIRGFMAGTLKKKLGHTATSTKSKSGDLAEKFAAVAEMSYVDLRSEWRRHFRSDAPKKLSRNILELGVAWKIQESSLGGLTATTRRQLTGLVQTMATKSDLVKVRKVSLRPGARIVRSWRGETHEILVVEDGFHWRGRTWASLSVIAREMTGTRWSGPRFFGLDRPAHAAPNRTRGPADA